jgi:hypothetical protein
MIPEEGAISSRLEETPSRTPRVISRLYTNPAMRSKPAPKCQCQCPIREPSLATRIRPYESQAWLFVRERRVSEPILVDVEEEHVYHVVERTYCLTHGTVCGYTGTDSGNEGRC